MGRPTTLVNALTSDMPIPKGTNRIYFPKVKQAREILKEKALELLAKYELIIDKAIESGDLETAGKHTQWLLEHLPNEDGERIIDPSAAKPKETEGNQGPIIQIGVLLSGTKPKELTPSIIEADIVKDEYAALLPKQNTSN